MKQVKLTEDDYLSATREMWSNMFVRALAEFRETGNPVYAWKTLLYAIRAGESIPQEVLRYLDDVALKITTVAAKPKKAKNRPVALAKALGMNKDKRGQGSVFSEYYDRKNDWKLAAEAFFEIEKRGYKDGAFVDVGERYKVSKATVGRAYDEYMEIWTAKARKLLTDWGNVRSNAILAMEGKTSAGNGRSLYDTWEAGIIISIIESHFHELL